MQRILVGQTSISLSTKSNIIKVFKSNMKIEIATKQDVPALLDLQRKAFGPLCEELGWNDAPPLTESVEHTYEEFEGGTTLKV